MSNVKYASVLAIREFNLGDEVTVLEPKYFVNMPVEKHIKALAAFARDKQRALSLLRIANNNTYDRNLNNADLELLDIILGGYMRFSTSEAYDARCISIAYKEVGHFSYDFGLAIASSDDQYNKSFGRNLAALRLEDQSLPFCWHVDIKETSTDRSIKIYSRVDGKLLYRDEIIISLDDLTYGTGKCPNARSITKKIYQTLNCLRYVPSRHLLFSWKNYERRDFEFKRYPRNSTDSRNPGFTKERNLW